MSSRDFLGIIPLCPLKPPVSLEFSGSRGLGFKIVLGFGVRSSEERKACLIAPERSCDSHVKDPQDAKGWPGTTGFNSLLPGG